MKPIIINPVDRDDWLKHRTKDITSTETPALFRDANNQSVSPYSTELELYLRKSSGEIEELEPNERMEWGNYLQDAIAEKFAHEQNWTIAKMTEYMRLLDHRIGASFDFRIIVGDRESADDGILEIKNVDGLVFRDQWIENEDGSIEAPLHIEIQLQTQMLVSGLKWGYIGALVAGNRGFLLRREADPELQKVILQKAKDFWNRVNTQTPPDFSFPDDAQVLIKHLSHVEGGTVLQADDGIAQLADEYSALGDHIKKLEEERSVVKAKILIAIGPAAKVVGDDFSISASEVAGSVVESFFRKPYRLFRVNKKKAK